MDMFKLLARSSNLQKTRTVQSGASQKVPSAGQGEGDVTATPNGLAKAPRGTKRKRRAANPGESSAGAELIPSFKNGKHKDPAVGGIAPSSKNSTSSGPDSPTMAEAERRHVLKKHKLKVTVLQYPAKEQNKAQKKALSQSSTGEGKKDTRNQLSPKPLASFDELRSRYGISRRLAANMVAEGYREPTDVQMGSLPMLLGSDSDLGLHDKRHVKGKNPRSSHVDLLTVAPTGSGKTLAFLIPTMQALLDKRRKGGSSKGAKATHEVQALIIAPTHELVDQIVNEARKLAVGTGINVSGMRKGMHLHKELLEGQDVAKNGNDEQEGHRHGKHAFLVKADILVSTPLLLLHTISPSTDSPPKALDTVQHLVLDEADVLLDQLFREQTLGIWNACSAPTLRTSLWSATIGSSIETFAQTFILDRRKRLDIDESSAPHLLLRLVVGLKDFAIPNMSHRLVYAASEQGKLLGLRQLLHPAAAPSTPTPSLQPPFLVFTQTIERAIALHSELLYDIPPEAGGSSRIAVLHSGLSETARSDIMAGFRKGEIWILITTDLLSRGVDFRGMNGVVNYDIPNTGASYVHRAGRTGRQGREGGVVVSLYTEEDIPYVKNVANVIAASKKAKKGSSTDGEGVQQWLLDSLPDVSKKTKKDLKMKGVESRRANAEGVDPRKLKKMRISTKSGYDRRLENRKKGIRDRSRRAEEKGSQGSEDGEFEGFAG